MGHYARASSDTGSLRAKIQASLLGLCTLIAASLSIAILLPFLPPLAWALAVAVVSYPLFEKLQSRLGHRGLTAALMVIAISLVFMVPTIWVAETLVRAGLEGLHQLLPALARGEWRAPLKDYPQLVENLGWIESSLQVPNLMQELAVKARGAIPIAIVSSAWGIVQGMLIMFITFFLFRDGRRLMAYTEGLLPLGSAETRSLTRRMGDTIHATLFGMIAVAILQGTLGGVMFWWLGLPAPVIWGSIMALLAIVPYLGTFIVWIPVALFFAAQGKWASAGILAVWGSVIIGLSDNLLYPFLVGKRLHYHTLIVFFFLLGGIVLFGTSGVVLGPMTLALTDGLLQACRTKLGMPAQQDAD
jgi:predicted PurR-regulated permease PerM